MLKAGEKHSPAILKGDFMAKSKDKVPVFIPKSGAGEDPVFYVSVSAENGGTRSFTLPRGKTSYVPDYVAEEIKRAERAKEALERRRSKLAERAQNL